MANFRLAILGLLMELIWIAPAIANPVSGIYIQKFSNAVDLIQLVVTSDGKVTGTIELVFLSTSGKLHDESSSLEGSIDGNQISLKSNVIFGWGQTLSGTVEGSTLHLITNGGQMNLLKSDLDTFAQEKSKLATNAATIVNASQQAKHKAEAEDYLVKLTSEGRSLEGVLAKLPQVESNADNFIAQTKQKRDSIVSRIKFLRAKLPFASSNDGSQGEVESMIAGLFSEMEGLKSEFDANIHFRVIDYNRLQSNMSNFKSHCDEGVSKYSLTLPSQCSAFSNLVASYQASRSNMRAKYANAGKMFLIENP